MKGDFLAGASLASVIPIIGVFLPHSGSEGSLILVDTAMPSNTEKMLRTIACLILLAILPVSLSVFLSSGASNSWRLIKWAGQ